jgi:transcriptional regulator with XRE-family HTH domain
MYAYTHTLKMSSGELMTEHRYIDTAAAQMLAAGLRTAARERQLSLREIARRLGYKQPAGLSHMALGRVPIPIDRAYEIANHVGLPPDLFLDAVLRQHHPNVEWALITGETDPFVSALQSSVDVPLSSLGAEHQRIVQEVVKDNKPEERWLTISEVAAVNLLREVFPHLTVAGLSIEELQNLRASIEIQKGLK